MHSSWFHSSRSASGHEEGDAAIIIDAVSETMGRDGTIIVPTLTSRREWVFDPATTPSPMDIIPETLGQRSGALRSCHAYHPIAAIVPRALEIIADLEQGPSPCDEGTPFAHIIEAEGSVLLPRVDQNTMLHTVESKLDIPYLQRPLVPLVGPTPRRKLCRDESVPLERRP